MVTTVGIAASRAVVYIFLLYGILPLICAVILGIGIIYSYFKFYKKGKHSIFYIILGIAGPLICVSLYYAIDVLSQFM